MSKESSKWSKEEDEALTKIIVAAVQLKWKNVAKEFQTLANFPKRTSKECHRRWANFLDPSINSEKWTQQEERILLESHIQYGNRWTLIEKRLPGRPNLFIKNHFYSMMRKGLRKVNNYIRDHFKPNVMRQLSHRFISKIVLLSGNEDSVDPSVVKLATDIKKQLFHEASPLADGAGEGSRLQRIIEIIRQLNRQTKRIKKKNILNLNIQDSLEKQRSQTEVRTPVDAQPAPYSNASACPAADQPCMMLCHSCGYSYNIPVNFASFIQVAMPMVQPQPLQVPYQVLVPSYSLINNFT